MLVIVPMLVVVQIGGSKLPEHACVHSTQLEILSVVWWLGRMGCVIFMFICVG